MHCTVFRSEDECCICIRLVVYRCSRQCSPRATYSGARAPTCCPLFRAARPHAGDRVPIARAGGAKEHCHQEQANNKHPWAQTPIPTRIWCLCSNTTGQRESFKRFARLGRTAETLSSRGAYPSRCPPPLRTRSRTAAAACGAQPDLVVWAPLRSPYHKKTRRPKEEDGRSPGLQRSRLEPLLSTHREVFVCGFVIMFVTCGGRTVLWRALP
jgi:hypothetical protein